MDGAVVSQRWVHRPLMRRQTCSPRALFPRSCRLLPARALAGDAGSTAFVATSYNMILLLFHRLRVYERLPPAGTPVTTAMASEGRS
ncbi:hypothetical protein C2845_PM04G07600 [Panicum miliaceum]|uniref:Uncharacterized protein n=1 Tax=Panicum miliaceum TaxID=4540 RepID=A0A3L6QNZ0_PANMI|nr:hypothetical protein C2845_PM04G07600 [Panicum miliaceum]